jgi:hypothetical protein
MAGRVLSEMLYRGLEARLSPTMNHGARRAATRRRANDRHEQMFGANEQVPDGGQTDQETETRGYPRPSGAHSLLGRKAMSATSKAKGDEIP